MVGSPIIGTLHVPRFLDQNEQQSVHVTGGTGNNRRAGHGLWMAYIPVYLSESKPFANGFLSHKSRWS